MNPKIALSTDADDLLPERAVLWSYPPKVAALKESGLP